MMTYFDVANVTKRFGDEVALDNVSMTVSEPSNRWPGRQEWQRQDHIDASYRRVTAY
jgi:hypothetical protein